jgi:4-amino-4-deoxy-L-arabinose transferase-like glycosyltransferase
MNVKSSNNKADTQPNRVSVFIVVVFVLAVCFSHIHQGSLGVDSIRYASIANSVLQTGKFFDLFDEYTELPYANKPPVLFWLVALSLKVFGFSTFSVKLTGALFSAFAVFLLWLITFRLYGQRAGLFSMLLFVLNSLFFRAVVDLNFESLVLCGSLCIIYTMLFLLRSRNTAIRHWLTIGIGLSLFFAAKPPYLLLILPALALALFYLPREVLVPQQKIKAWAALLIPIMISLGWLPFVANVEYFPKAFDNQIVEPLTLTNGFWANFKDWLSDYFIYLAPLSWLGITALWHGAVDKYWLKDKENQFLIAWLLPGFGVMLFITCRGRYLLVPSLAYAIITGRYLAEVMPRVSQQHLERICLFVGTVIPLLVFVFGVSFHGFFGVFDALEMNPEFVSQPPLICSGSGKSGDVPHPTKKRMEMLIALAFKKHIEVHDAGTLPYAQLAPGTMLLADTKCLKELSQKGLVYTDLRHFSDSSLVQTR